MAPSRIVLLAASSVLNSYLPAEQRQDHVLATALDATYGPGKAEVHNWSDNGEYIARFLLNGTYERFRESSPGVDLFIIRYALNDAKRMKAEEFLDHNEKLIALLKEDFPQAAYIMETGFYVDYPAHYPYDRNAETQPYWEASRTIAQRHGFPLNDLYLASKEATLQGRWDLRIRSQKVKPLVVDASKDHEHVGEMEWFSDIHPNPNGICLAVETQITLLKELYPQALPTGGGKRERPARSGQEYSDYLGFPFERRDILISHPRDGFQKATRA